MRPESPCSAAELTTGPSRRQPRRAWAGGQRAAVALLLLLLLLAAGGAAAGAPGREADANAVRAEEIAHCLPGEAVAWPDGQDRPAPAGAVRLVYRHAGAPPAFDEAMVLGALQRAAQAWAGCGVPTEVITEAAAAFHPAEVVVVQWNAAEARGGVALANLARRSLSLGAPVFALLAERRPGQSAFPVLQMAISHELGHFYGLMAHSRRCVDVMSYYTGGQGQTCSTRDGRPYTALPEYRALLPTACDIARCRALNGR